MNAVLSQLDDRMQLALRLLNRARLAVDLPEMTADEVAILRARHGWRSYLQFLKLTSTLGDLSEVEALLGEWHAWHHGV